jgi:hypothetical protein
MTHIRGTIPPPRISLETTPDLSFRARVLAASRDISVSELIRQLIHEEIARRNLPLAALRGLPTDADRDLLTAKKDTENE